MITPNLASTNDGLRSRVTPGRLTLFRVRTVLRRWANAPTRGPNHRQLTLIATSAHPRHAAAPPSRQVQQDRRQDISADTCQPRGSTRNSAVAADLVGLLQQEEVAAAAHDVKAGVRDPGGQQTAVRRRDDRVIVARQNQGGRSDAVQPQHTGPAQPCI